MANNLAYCVIDLITAPKSFKTHALDDAHQKVTAKQGLLESFITCEDNGVIATSKQTEN